MAKDFVCPTCRYVRCRCQDDPLMAAEIRLAKASDAWMDAQDAFELAKQNYHYAFNEGGGHAMTDDVVRRFLIDLADHFHDLNDDPDALLGEYPRVSIGEGRLVLLHESEPWGIALDAKMVDVMDDGHAAHVGPFATGGNVPAVLGVDKDGRPIKEYVIPLYLDGQGSEGQ